MIFVWRPGRDPSSGHDRLGRDPIRSRPTKNFRSRPKARVATPEKSGSRPDLGRDRGSGRPTRSITPNTRNCILLIIMGQSASDGVIGIFGKKYLFPLPLPVANSASIKCLWGDFTIIRVPLHKSSAWPLFLNNIIGWFSLTEIRCCGKLGSDILLRNSFG